MIETMNISMQSEMLERLRIVAEKLNTDESVLASALLSESLDELDEGYLKYLIETDEALQDYEKNKTGVEMSGEDFLKELGVEND